MARLHPDDAPWVWKLRQAADRQPSEVLLEHRIVLPDGDVRYLSSRGEICRDAQGQVLHVSGTTIDVTDRVYQ